MPRKPSPTLTEGELRLMDALWRLEAATVAQITAALPPPPIAYNSVLTTMRILEQKGYVRHEEIGRAFRYVPAVAREAVAQHAVGHLISRFFDNRSGSLALRLIEREKPSKSELARLRALIDAYEEEQP